MESIYKTSKVTTFQLSRIALIIGAFVFCLNLIASLLYHQDALHYVLSKHTDPLGYYQYLPAIFIESNLKCMIYSATLNNGNMLSAFHIGIAILQLPFFLLGHLYTLITGGDASGYSINYAVSQIIGVSAYLGIALAMLFQLLRNKFTLTISVITVFVLYLGTNVFYYAFAENGMSHVYSFFLFTALIYLTHVFEEKRNWKTALYLSVTAVIIVLVKPNNGVVLLYFLLFNTCNWTSFITRLKKVFLPISTWKPGIIVAIFLVALQVGYWHYVSGQFLVFSYGALGEGFFWTNPSLLKVLFSPQNGWLIYSPVLIIPMLGLIYLGIKNQLNSRVTLIIWMMAWYIFSSWWAWWFGGAYGHRAFVEYIAFLAIPMAFVLTSIKEKSRIGFGFIMVFLLLFVWVNIGMSYVYHSPWDGPNWGWNDYFRVLEKAIKFGV